MLAYAFTATGRRRLLEEDFVGLLAHERHWFPPSKVRAYVQAGRAQGLLRSVGAHAVELAAEWQGERLPLDYRPDASRLESAVAGTAGATSPQASLFHRILAAWREGTHESEADIVAGINELQSSAGGLLRAEAAALWWGALRGLDVAPWIAEVEDEIRKSARQHARPQESKVSA